MPSLDECYADLVAALTAPGQATRATPEPSYGWESVVRAAFSRGPTGRRVEQAIAGLGDAGWLEPNAIGEVPPTEIRDTLDGAGIAFRLNQATLLQRLARWYSEAFADGAHPPGEQGPSTSLLRDQLLTINGVGPGTADAILLALGRACLPVDPGLYRVLVRHGWCDITADYDEASETLARHARGDASELKQVHRELSGVARRFCGVRVPKCDRCPLRDLLPEGGPIDPRD